MFVGVCEHKAQSSIQNVHKELTKWLRWGGLPAATSEDPSSVPGENYFLKIPVNICVHVPMHGHARTHIHGHAHKINVVIIIIVIIILQRRLKKYQPPVIFLKK